MKKLYLLTCLTMICFLLLPSKARAANVAGGEIVYEHLSDSTYRVFFKLYRDCTGITTAPTYTLCYKNSCNTTDIRDTVLNQWPGLIPPGVNNGASVAVGCSNASTTCDQNPSGTPLPGYQEWWYYTVVNLPYQCDSWTFSVAVSARNSSNNLAGQATFYVETTFNNAYAQGNNSPYFANKPITYCCINTPFTYNNGATDPDGDSLVTEVINPLTSNGSCSDVPTNCTLNTVTPPISFPNNPIQSNNSFVLNSFTSSMSFTPPVTGPQTLTVRTKEYRNGILIGSVMRDVQVQVISCYVPGGISPMITGAGFVNGMVQGVIDEPLNFCFDVISPDSEAVLILSDNSSLSLGGNASSSYTNQKNDSVNACISWTPTQTGLYNLTVAVVDSTCRPPGIVTTNTFTIPVFIWYWNMGVKDAAANEISCQLFPNPGQGEFTITHSSLKTETAAIAVYTLEGKKLYSTGWKLNKGDNSKLLDLTKLPKGFYMIILHTSAGSSFTKAVIE